MKTWPVALQMWSLADLREKDLPGALKALAEMGYHGVEGCLNKWPEASDLRKMLDDLGLEMPSVHVNYREMLKDVGPMCEYFDALGVYNLVIPSTSFGVYPEGTPWTQRIADMAAIADKLAGSKFTLLFHNHDHELIEQCEGRDALDAIFDTIPAEKLKVQIDTYFVKHVGRDPGAYIRRYAGRLPLLHLKEKPAQPSPYVNTEIGRGIIDWSDVFAAAEAADVAWFVIEQKCEQFDPLTSAKMSIDYLKSCGVARPR